MRDRGSRIKPTEEERGRLDDFEILQFFFVLLSNVVTVCPSLALTPVSVACVLSEKSRVSSLMSLSLPRILASSSQHPFNLILLFLDLLDLEPTTSSLLSTPRGCLLCISTTLSRERILDLLPFFKTWLLRELSRGKRAFKTC